MAENYSRKPTIRLRPGEQRAVLLFGDLLAAVTSLAGSVYAWREYSWYRLLATGISPEKAAKFFSGIVVPFWFYLLPIGWLLLLIELYEPQAAANWRRTLRGVAVAAFIGLIVYALIFITIKDPNSLPRIGVGAFLVIASILTLGWRRLYIRLYTAQGMTRRVLIVGAGRAGETLAKAYKNIWPPPFYLIGFVDDDPKKIGSRVEGFRVFGSNDRLLQIIEQQNISDLVVAITGAMMGSTFQTILDAQESGVVITRMPTMYEEMVGRVPIHHLESDWLIRSFVDEARVSGFYELGKRVSDILGGLVGFGILVAVLPFAALAIAIDSGLPIFYAQNRLGKGGKPFKLFKFRTMVQNAEEDGQARLAAEDDPRITRVGKILRKTRLDEFPQFLNVLRGEMSLVGPRAERPELVAQFQKEIPFYRARLLVKPGISGWAQINYGYVSTVYETGVKLEYDLYYIKHRTFWMDVNIMLRTVGTVFGFKGR
ncbi:MAG: sugar transferase [Chloroflexi bacterium]|nr:sugar transferase [Chloroflexota bacterium]